MATVQEVIVGLPGADDVSLPKPEPDHMAEGFVNVDMVSGTFSP
jgi:hypothetical protein